MSQKWRIITLFPEFFASPLSTGLLGKAVAGGLIDASFVNPRDFSSNPHNNVDDRPYGGGAGMVMQAAPLASALRSIDEPGRMILLSPRGKIFDERLARELAQEKNLALLCGRYEGIDERLAEIFPLEPVCIGPYILNGGETAALAILEATARLLPGFMGKPESTEAESFEAGLLEHPHYTRPEIFEGRKTPQTLLHGDHAKIARWRREQSLAATLLHNPALLDEADLKQEDAAFLKSLPRRRPAANFSFCLLHHPVCLEKGLIGSSSLTNLDIHDIARISSSYGMAPFYVVTPLADQLILLEQIIRHWTTGAGGRANPDRKKALEKARPAADFSEVLADVQARTGRKPFVAASSAVWPRDSARLLGAARIREIAARRPCILCLGTARGLAPEFIDVCDGLLRPIRFLSENHLPVRAAAAIAADRIFGDYC